MEIKSNGYFKTRDFDIDTNEDIDIYDLDDNGDIVANLMVWGYDKLINEDRITIEIFKKLEELVENKYSTIENFKEVCKTKSHTGFKARDITTTNT